MRGHDSEGNMGEGCIDGRGRDVKLGVRENNNKHLHLLRPKEL
jgi:hypothetical protein